MITLYSIEELAKIVNARAIPKQLYFSIFWIARGFRGIWNSGTHLPIELIFVFVPAMADAWFIRKDIGSKIALHLRDESVRWLIQSIGKRKPRWTISLLDSDYRTKWIYSRSYRFRFLRSIYTFHSLHTNSLRIKKIQDTMKEWCIWLPFD